MSDFLQRRVEEWCDAEDRLDREVHGYHAVDQEWVRDVQAGRRAPGDGAVNDARLALKIARDDLRLAVGRSR